jgi:hypothetical protein
MNKKAYCVIFSAYMSTHHAQIKYNDNNRKHLYKMQVTTYATVLLLLAHFYKMNQ